MPARRRVKNLFQHKILLKKFETNIFGAQNRLYDKYNIYTLTSILVIMLGNNFSKYERVIHHILTFVKVYKLNLRYRLFFPLEFLFRVG